MLRRLHPEQPDTFAFTPANQAWAEAQITKYPEGRQASAIIPLLWRAQEQEGWLSRAAIEHVADMLGMAHIRALEVATLTMAAADGFRLSVRTAHLLEPVPEPISVVVPGKALNELARVSGEEQAQVGVYINPARSQISFHLQGDAGANQGLTENGKSSEQNETTLHDRDPPLFPSFPRIVKGSCARVNIIRAIVETDRDVSHA